MSLKKNLPYLRKLSVSSTRIAKESIPSSEEEYNQALQGFEKRVKKVFNKHNLDGGTPSGVSQQEGGKSGWEQFQKDKSDWSKHDLHTDIEYLEFQDPDMHELEPDEDDMWEVYSAVEKDLNKTGFIVSFWEVEDSSVTLRVK